MNRILKTSVVAFLLAAASVGVAEAQSIRNTMGMTARAGILSPADSKEPAGGGRDFLVDSDMGIVGGIGFIYGVDDHLAFEVDINFSRFNTDSMHGDADMKDMGVGIQYRFPPANPKLTPYMGLGLDVLIPDYERSNVDAVFGGHVRGGFDYFFDRAMAFNVDFKAIGGFQADVDKGGKFDPSSVSCMAGIRFFFR